MGVGSFPPPFKARAIGHVYDPRHIADKRREKVAAKFATLSISREDWRRVKKNTKGNFAENCGKKRRILKYGNCTCLHLHVS